MKTTNDDWIRIECQHCLFHKSNADMENVQSTCKRLDHKHLRFAKPVFLSYDCGAFQINTCADFEPHPKRVPWLYNHWGEVKQQIIPYSDSTVISLNVDGDTETRWAIKALDFYNNTFLNNDGSLKWLYKYYTKQSRRNVIGYETYYETPDGKVYTSREFKDKERYYLSEKEK